MRYFEYRDSKSSKFWQVEQHGSDLNIGWGKVGADGQSQTKSFADEAKAAGAMEKLIKEKTRKGYQEVNAEGGQAEQTASRQATKQSSSGSVSLPPENTPPTQPAVSCTDLLQKLESAQKSEPETPPWLKNGEPLDFDEKFLAKAFPGRRFPGKTVTPDAAKSWQALRTYLQDIREAVKIDNSDDKNSIYPWIVQALQRLQDDVIEGSFESDVGLFLLTLAQQYRQRNSLSGNDEDQKSIIVTDYLVAQYGLEYAVDVLICAEQCEIKRQAGSSRFNLAYLFYQRVTKDELLYANSHRHYSPAELRFRLYLAQAEESVWAACAEKLRQSMPLLKSNRCFLVAFLLPERPEIARGLLSSLEDVNRQAAHWLRFVLTEPDEIKQLETVCYRSHALFFLGEALPTFVQDRGLDAAGALEFYGSMDEVSDVLSRIGTPQAVMILLDFCLNGVRQAEMLDKAMQRWPVAAMYALAEWNESSGALNDTDDEDDDDDEYHYDEVEKNARLIRKRACADTYLTALVTGSCACHLTEVFPWLSETGKQRIRDILQRCPQPDNEAGTNHLPAILVSPPWLSSVSPVVKSATSSCYLQLEMLSLDPVEDWEEGLREVLLSSVYKGQVEQDDLREKYARLIVDKMGIRPGLADKTLSERLIKQATEAVRQQDGEALVSVLEEYRQAFYLNTLDFYVVDQLSEDVALTVWNGFSGTNRFNERYFVAKYGLKALPGLMTLLRDDFKHRDGLILSFACEELSHLVIKHFLKSKTLRPLTRKWLLKYSEFAAAAAIPGLFSKKTKERNDALTVLRLLAENQHMDTLLAVAERYQNEQVISVLKQELMTDPLLEYPAKIQPLPLFWSPKMWRRPVLKSNGKPLPESALDHLSTMLTFPCEEKEYAGFEQVKACCTPQSLADFAWDAFSAWLAVCSPAKQGWILQALGTFGNDETARRLTEYIRVWPGQSQHQKATAGLDILRRIGSDVALMLLNSIAQKVKFKGLQENARQRIKDIAASRKLSVEDLEDRLVPDFGLDAQGRMILDFGPRQFKVGFDETLQPCVFDMDGVRLKTLPRSNKNDDAELAKRASDLFKQLKKEIQAVSSLQVARLEKAMCSQRLWDIEAFRLLLVNHPLLRHLTQRLVWGIYRKDNVAEGVLMDCFRVAEDGSFSTGQDDVFHIPDGNDFYIGIPHPILFSSQQKQDFTQLFEDYQLAQPFPQLTRECYFLTEDEKAQTTLKRWSEKKVKSERFYGLLHKGWEKGDVGGGYLNDLDKPVQGNRRITLSLEPGISVGYETGAEEQQIKEVAIKDRSSSHSSKEPAVLFGVLGTIEASEFIRNMETLTGNSIQA